MFIPHPASPLAAHWLAELRAVQSSLDRDPANAFAWYWRIRIKLMSFLLARYGNDPRLRDPRFRGERNETASSSAAKRAIQRQVSKPLRSQADARRVLQHIADVNVDRA